MRALEAVVGTTWALQPEALGQMVAIAARQGDPEAVAARAGRKMEGARTVTMRDGIAVVPVVGPIFRRANLFTEISGATSIELTATDFTRALEDPAVKAILLDIDSPGGEVNGTGEFAALVRKGGKSKPVWAYVGGTGASGAYYIASAAERVIAAPSAVLGSIGVVMVWRNHLQPGEVELVSSVSPLKRASAETEEGRNELQRVVDALAGVFVREVAGYRGVSKEHVVERFGAGGMMVGAEAVAVGMADGIGTFEDVIRELSGSGRAVQSLKSKVQDGAGAGHRGEVVSGERGAPELEIGECRLAIADCSARKEVAMDRGMALEQMGTDELREEVLRLRVDTASLQAAEERRRVSAALGGLRLPDERGTMVLAPVCREELAEVVAGIAPESRQPLMSALAGLALMPLPGPNLGGEESPLLNRADHAVIAETARLSKRPVADVQREFVAARERQIAQGRYRGARG
jgi:signal peptide peptidase SppA